MTGLLDVDALHPRRPRPRGAGPAADVRPDHAGRRGLGRDGRFVPADVILWATGFRAALDHLAPLRLRAPGGGITMDGTQVAGDPRVHLVGYGPSASTIGANRAGQSAARQLRRLLRPAGELPRTA